MGALFDHQEVQPSENYVAQYCEMLSVILEEGKNNEIPKEVKSTWKEYLEWNDFTRAEEIYIKLYSSELQENRVPRSWGGYGGYGATWLQKQKEPLFIC